MSRLNREDPFLAKAWKEVDSMVTVDMEVKEQQSSLVLRKFFSAGSAISRGTRVFTDGARRGFRACLRPAIILSLIGMLGVGGYVSVPLFDGEFYTAAFNEPLPSQGYPSLSKVVREYDRFDKRAIHQVILPLSKKPGDIVQYALRLEAVEMDVTAPTSKAYFSGAVISIRDLTLDSEGQLESITPGLVDAHVRFLLDEERVVESQRLYRKNFSYKDMLLLGGASKIEARMLSDRDFQLDEQVLQGIRAFVGEYAHVEGPAGRARELLAFGRGVLGPNF